MNLGICCSKNVPDYSASREKNDLGFLTFDLQTDLTPLFNWNVKQLFLYLTAEYETEANKINQVNSLNSWLKQMWTSLSHIHITQEKKMEIV